MIVAVGTLVSVGTSVTVGVGVTVEFGLGVIVAFGVAVAQLTKKSVKPNMYLVIAQLIKIHLLEHSSQTPAAPGFSRLDRLRCP